MVSDEGTKGVMPGSTSEEKDSSELKSLAQLNAS